MDKEHNQAAVGNSSDDTDISRIIAIAEAKGWSVNTDEEEQGHVVFEFSQYTPAGQDFNFSAELTNGEARTLIENIKEYYKFMKKSNHLLVYIVINKPLLKAKT